MKQVLFEEDGHFRVGTILTDAGTSFQVEAAHGKRSKVKGNAVLLRFDGEPLGAFMSMAEALARDLDAQFLWEASAEGEFGFEELAREYYGRAPTPQEATAVALLLHGNPMYFYKRGKGRYQAAAEQNLKAALAGVEKRRKQQEQIDAWSAELEAGRLPEALGPKVDVLLFKPDKTSLEWRALDQAATAKGLSPPKLLAAAGALAGPEDYFLRRFAFEHFPNGLGFPGFAALETVAGLPEAEAPIFSIDDEETTEIDDAFSVQRRDDGSFRIGIHIAAPALLFGRDHALEAVARSRMSTVYFPGGKITMLPDAAVQEATLAQGRRMPAASLYLEVAADGVTVGKTESRLEWVTIADNLRLSDLDVRMSEEVVASGRIDGPHGEDLLLLWKLARALKVLRGAGEEKPDRLDYTFRVSEGRVAIVPRKRGSPVDTLVSELMILLNSTWGRLLAERGYDAVYRNQKGGKTRMEVVPGEHEWLGVSHYAWASSPLRRFSDLANQRQLVAMLRAAEPAYSRDELTQAARDFDTQYEAYNEHQRALERYWCLKYIVQEGIEETGASVIRDDLVRIDGMPLVLRVVGLPAGTAAGERVQVAFGEVDLWEAHVLARYAGK